MFGWRGGRCIVRVITCAWLVCLDGIPVLRYFFHAVIGGRVESTVFLRPLVIHHDHRIYEYDKGWNKQSACNINVGPSCVSCSVQGCPAVLCLCAALVVVHSFKVGQGQKCQRDQGARMCTMMMMR